MMSTGKRTIYLMGTVIQLWLQHEDPEPLLEQAEARLRDYEKRFSANRSDSQLMEITRNAGKASVQVAPDLFELIRIGKAQSLARDSFLNIAIGPLIQAWRIGFGDAKQPPQEEIDRLLSVIDPACIVLDESNHSVFLTQPGMGLDLGALAKGYFADQMIAFFRQAGATAAFIDLGGNVLTFGESPNHADGFWRVGIQNPFLPRGHHAAVLKVKDGSVVTSGIYERKLQLDGVTYHHIFDSQTGYPVRSNVASLTVVSQQSLDGEIWTTRLYGKNGAEVIVALNELEALGGLVITTEGGLACSENLKALLL